MTAVVQGLPLRNNFFTAQKEAATPWSRLYFPEEASYHAVNSLLCKRLQETLGEQDRAIHEQKTQKIHTHNIAMTAEVPVAELKQVIESLAPNVAPPRAQVLPEAAAQQMRAENMRMQAEIQATLEAHQLEMKICGGSRERSTSSSDTQANASSRGCGEDRREASWPSDEHLRPTDNVQ